MMAGETALQALHRTRRTDNGRTSRPACVTRRSMDGQSGVFVSDRYGSKLLNFVGRPFLISTLAQMIETEYRDGQQVTEFDSREETTDKRFDDCGSSRPRRVQSGM